MLGLLEVHMIYENDLTKSLQGLFTVFWMKITSPTLIVEDILCKSQDKLIVNHQLVLHGKKE